MRLPDPLPIDLREFFRTGRFDCLRIGQDRELILHNFPDPDGWSSGVPLERAGIWCYGNIELHFDGDDRLWMIYSDYIDTLSGAPSLNVDPWILSAPEKLTLIVVMAALNREGIDFAKTTRVAPACPGVRLALASGVELQFEHLDEAVGDCDPNTMRLASFSFHGGASRLHSAR